MVLEVALFDVRPGAEQAFAQAYAQARPLLAQSEGCRSVRMTQGVETPTRFVLLVEWDSLDAHELFRASPRFGEWRALVAPHFATPPLVEHYQDL
ncbi:MAG: antibiotic biosynthesis monooxygenase [Frankiales bacterium]|jgi:heme-degrading monooxygenase HmoA|nr:antibiotic biosynthesis monooxygenase [Frankiales bacterium]MCW2587121.1 antibiotic biosynthesis monooxygenase [Frankiales bacterium]